MGAMEPELAIFCNQKRPQVEGLKHQLSHKTLGWQWFLPAKYFGENPHQRDLRDFIQQRMGAKAESHSQTLGRAQGVVVRRERKKQRNQRGQKQQENRAHRTKWPGLMGVCRDQGICKECTLGLLHICYDWEAWCSCETWQWQWGGLCLTILPTCETFFLVLCCLVQWWCDGMCLVFL